MPDLEHNRGDLQVVDTEAALAERLADSVIADAKSAIAQRGVFNVAFAGGTTPKATYELLAREDRKKKIEWSHVHIFFSDERCVAPTDVDSNYRMAKLALLDHIDIPIAQIHRMRGDIDPPKAAVEYGALLRAHFGGEPRFDLIMLGMGPDGHTASLFPGADPEERTQDLVRAVYVDKFKTDRITFTPHTINAARHVIIAAAGAAKSDALYDVLKGKYDPIDYPIQIVHPVDGTLTWLVDRAAAAKL